MSAGNALDSRVEDLGRASKRAALLSLSGFLVVLATLGYGAIRLADVERELRASVDSLSSRKQQLLTTIEDLTARIDGLRGANDSLSARARGGNPTGAARTELQRAENAKYAVGVYGFAVSPEQYDRVRKRLERDGYVISQGSLLSQRLPWLSRRSSVLYYDDGSAGKARGIADSIGALTGLTFSIVRGAGRAVVPGQERWTFFVHYVGQ